MNYDQITGIIRSLVPAVLAFVAAKGWIPGDSIPLITTAVVAIAAAIWSVFNNTTAHKLTSAINESSVAEVAAAFEEHRRG